MIHVISRGSADGGGTTGFRVTLSGVWLKDLVPDGVRPRSTSRSLPLMPFIRAAAASARDVTVPLPPGNAWRRIRRGTAAAVAVLVLSGCTASDPAMMLNPGER